VRRAFFVPRRFLRLLPLPAPPAAATAPPAAAGGAGTAFRNVIKPLIGGAVFATIFLSYSFHSSSLLLFNCIIVVLPRGVTKSRLYPDGSTEDSILVFPANVPFRIVISQSTVSATHILDSSSLSVLPFLKSPICVILTLKIGLPAVLPLFQPSNTSPTFTRAISSGLHEGEYAIYTIPSGIKLPSSINLRLPASHVSSPAVAGEERQGCVNFTTASLSRIKKALTKGEGFLDS